MKKLTFALIAPVLAALLVGCAQEPPRPTPPQLAGEMPPPDFFQPARPLQDRPEKSLHLPEYRINFGDQLEIIYQTRTDLEPDAYRIQIEDRLSIRFPFQPDLNQTVQVGSDGTIHLLLIDEPVKAFGMTVKGLSDHLRKAYADSHIRNPRLTVVVDKANVKVEELKKAITTSPRGQSRLIPVKPDGRITLPVVGDIMAYGKTTRELRADLNAAYRAQRVSGVDVTANLLIVRPLDVYVMGEVGRPGRHRVSYRTTLTQAVAQAGGWDTARSNAEKVLLIRRRGMKVPRGAVINLAYLTRGIANQAIDDEREDPPDFEKHQFDPFLKDGDVIYVPSNRLAKNADWIRMVFTEGLRAIGGFSSTYSVDDSVDWLGPNP
jgi:polysaccharide export outer membrane protein